jgi:hypothetical protein
MVVRSVFFASLTAFAGVFSAGAATAPSLNPTADTFVDSAHPGYNYGAAGALGISATGSSNGEFDSFIRFNLASTETYFNGLYGAGNWTVQSITLQLTSTTNGNAIFNSNAAGEFLIQANNAGTWVEGNGMPNTPDTTTTDLNYTNHAAYESAADPSLGMFAFAGGTSGANTYNLTLASTLVADVQNGTDASMYLSAADTAVSYLFNSTNFGTASSRPIVVVTAIPEPGAGVFLILGAGALALGALRWRRHV